MKTESGVKKDKQTKRTMKTESGVKKGKQTKRTVKTASRVEKRARVRPSNRDGQGADGKIGHTEKRDRKYKLYWKKDHGAHYK